MKSLLLGIAFMFSITLAHADEGSKPRKHTSVPKGKISYSGEKKYKKTFGKHKPATKQMFAGEGVRGKSKR